MADISIKRWFVEEWWSERVVAGSQIAIPDGETRGEKPWKRTVSIDALHRDFERFMYGHPKAHRLGTDLTKSGFMMILRNILPDDTETIYARFDMAGQTRRLRAIRFKDLSAYKARAAA